MIKNALARAAAFGAVTLVASHAFAGSAATGAYVTLAAQDLDVLTSSSQLAAERATKESLKTFARDELQAPVAAQPAVADAGVPVVVAANMGETSVPASDGVQTSRSAAIDPVVDPSIYQAPLGTGVEMPTATAALAYLQTTQGPAFDWAYKAVQETALLELRGLEDAYSRTGDDPGLRASTLAQLPKIDARLAALRSL